MQLKDHMQQHFVCDMNALTKEQRTRHQELAKQLRPAVSEFVELPNGYEAKFESGRDLELEIVEFIKLELLCCPFFTLELVASTDGKPTLLRVTGQNEIKPFIRAEFGISETQSEAQDA